MKVLALVSDLLFESKLSGMARVVGAELRAIRRAEDLIASVGDAQRVLVDLNAAGDVLGEVRRLRAARPDVPVIGFLSHVQVDLAQAAREAGVDPVLSRSRFTEQLAELLQAQD